MPIPKNHDIYFEGKKYSFLNPLLTKQQQLDDTQIEILKSLHIQKVTIEKNMLSLNPETDLKILKSLKKNGLKFNFFYKKIGALKKMKVSTLFTHYRMLLLLINFLF